MNENEDPVSYIASVLGCHSPAKSAPQGVFLGDGCYHCCRRIWGTRRSLLPRNFYVQKFVVSFSTIELTAGSTFAVLWPMARSQTLETQSELLQLFSPFIRFPWPKFFAAPDGVLSVSDWSFLVLWFCRISDVRWEKFFSCFSRLWSFEFVWANKSSCVKAVDYNWFLKTKKFAASSLVSRSGSSQSSFSCGEKFFVAKLRTPSKSRSVLNPSLVKMLTVFMTPFAKRTSRFVLESFRLTGG